jgi:hypothetical protein
MSSFVEEITPAIECIHIWRYRAFKGCITSNGEEPLTFYQRVCRKCGKMEWNEEI